MIEIRTKIKKWGNSLGIVIPKNSDLKEGDEVNILITPKTNPLKKTFGVVKFSKSVKQMSKEIDEELYYE